MTSPRSMDNHPIFFLIFNLSNHSPLLDNLMIFGARYLILIAFLLFFILGLKGGIKEKKAFLLAILALPVATIIIMGIHLFFVEPRPFVTYNFTPLYPFNPDASFPSRHASFIAVIAFSYLYYKSRWALAFLTCTIWVGISRIYVGIHYPLDILGGFIVGILSLIIALHLKKLIKISFFR